MKWVWVALGIGVVLVVLGVVAYVRWAYTGVGESGPKERGDR